MAALSHHKLTYALPGSPWGDGRDGNLTISTDTTQSVTNKSCSGTSGSNTLTIASSGFSNGDIVLIHQTRGTGVGQWQFAKVVSGGGSTSLTLAKPLVYTFTDSGSSQAQVFYVPQYGDVTVNSTKTWSAPAWDGNVGGILVFASRGTVTINGSISANSKGFIASGSYEYQGEGTSGVGTGSNTANGNAGGGSYRDGAGGGGNANSGSTGNNAGGGYIGVGGSSSGEADLDTITFGGSGGSARDVFGGNGGGIILVICLSITIDNSTGLITSTGANGASHVTGNNEYGGAGAGAGGSIGLQARVATLNTTRITASGGTGGTTNASNSASGGNGSVGRIHLEYLSSYTGTTSPTLDVEQNLTLVPAVRRGMFI